MTWYEGRKPDTNPTNGEVEWGNDFNMAMVGSQGIISHNNRPNSPRLYPNAYWQDFRRNLPAKKYERIKGNLIDEWVRAIKGEGLNRDPILIMLQGSPKWRCWVFWLKKLGKVSFGIPRK